MARRKRDPSDLDLPMGVFQVRADWYDEYWLKPEKVSPPGNSTLRWGAAVYAGLAVAVFSLVIVFVAH